MPSAVGNGANGKLSENENGIRDLPPEPTSFRPVQGDLQHLDEDESTPLLGHGITDLERNNSSATERSNSSNRPKRSWWTMISIALLLILTLNIIIFAFIIPSATQSYARQATTYRLHLIQVQNFTDDGLIAHAHINITIDSSRVNSTHVRNFGVIVTSIFKHAYTQPCNVTLFLPEYNRGQVAIVGLPALAFDIRNHHTTNLDIVANIAITNSTLSARVVGDFMSGNRKEIEAIAETDVHIKAGWIPLGRHHVEQEVIVQGR